MSEPLARGAGSVDIDVKRQVQGMEPVRIDIDAKGGVMEAFGIIGMSLGTLGFIYGMNSMARIGRLTKKLMEKGVLDQDYKC
jgi:hypothetical protein